MAKGTSDEQAKEYARKGINKLSKRVVKIAEFLSDVALGVEQDDVLDKLGSPVMVEQDGKKVPLKIKPDLKTRVAAAKTFKEMVVDKITPDVKDTPKKITREGKSMVAALKDLHEKSLKK